MLRLPSVFWGARLALSDIVRDCGVVGAGGAGFPTHVKIRSRVEVLIANGAECEPVLVTDQWLMAQHPREICEAIRAVGEAVGARRLVFATKHKYDEVIKRFKPFLNLDPPIELFELGDFYPSGDEHTLVHEVTGRIVPEGGIPLHVSVLVQNVGTLLNIYKALKGSPVIMKHVTVAGEVRSPGVYIVPIGTRAIDCIALAGGATVEDFAIIDGGPMMGRLLGSVFEPVTKTTSGLLVLKKDHPLVQRRTTADMAEKRLALSVCCNCRMCTDLCPRHLLGHRIEPHRAMRAIANATENDIHVLAMGYLCCLCNVCEAYACPMGLSPRRIFEQFKARLSSEKLPQIYKASPEKTLDAYEWSKVPKERLAQRLRVSQYLLPKVGEPISLVEDIKTVFIPMKQHSGVPCIPIVQENQHVREGECIGIVPDGALGAPVHAPFDGIVKQVEKDKVIISRS